MSGTKMFTIELIEGEPTGQPESHMSMDRADKRIAELESQLADLREFAYNRAPKIAAEELRKQREEFEAQLAEANRDRTDPTFDATDAAHPAWWRGHDYSSMMFKEKMERFRREKETAEAQAATLSEQLIAVTEAAFEANSQLRAALTACDVAMDTAADQGVWDILPPAYRDSWAAAHVGAQEALKPKENK